MRCPICGAKLKDEKCPYCLITNKQVIYASNKQAKALKKENKEKNNVHTSNIRPKDVNKVKIWLFTVLGGWFGADSFLTGKYYKGMYSLFTYIAVFISTTLVVFTERFMWGENALTTFSYLQSLFSIFGAISFMLWFSGVVQLITKKYKYPVVLPSSEDAQKLYLEDLEEQRKKQLEKEQKGNKN